MKFYVTTPIYYVNDKPHIGHAYTTIAADVLARYHRLKGDEVFFLTGTDENAQKNVQAAEKLNKDTQTYVDEMSFLWQKTWNDLGLSHDDFIRTTEERHLVAVKKFWEAVQAKGDIYEGEYEGWYCVGCESFKTESDLVNEECPSHKKKPEWLKEKNYFFRLTNYRDQLLAHIDAHPDFIQPVARRNEVRSYVEKFMTDVSISRSSLKWGIQVPGDEDQRIYVWFDALINYLTAVGYGVDEVMFKKFWPADLHLVGKDIIKFHCALWPAMLFSAGVALPHHVFAHGFFTIDGEKMSKTIGNVIDPIAVAQNFGADVLRYFLFREITFGEDGDFSIARLEQRYDGELASELGNLVQRVLIMAQKYGVASAPKIELSIDGWTKDYTSAMNEFRLHDGLQEAGRIVREANQLIDKQAPWKLAKDGKREELEQVLNELLTMIHAVACMLEPFMPTTSERIFSQLKIMTAEPLFPRRNVI
ncbi:MAG: methionine--tRNA ligase [Patescibacteria group bacterium]